MAKAQMIAMDFMVSMFIALLLVITYVVLWSIYSDRYTAFFKKDTADLSIISVADALVTSQGSTNWNLNSNFSNATNLSLGLADTKNVLNPDKVDAFFKMDCADAKRLLGLQGNISIELQDTNGITYNNYSLCPDPPFNANMSDVTRLAYLNLETVWLRVRSYG